MTTEVKTKEVDLRAAIDRMGNIAAQLREEIASIRKEQLAIFFVTVGIKPSTADIKVVSEQVATMRQLIEQNWNNYTTQ